VEIADAARLSDMHSIGPICWAAPQLPTCSWIQPGRHCAGIDPDARHRRCSPGKPRTAATGWSHLELLRRRHAVSILPMQTIVIPAYAHGHLATPVIDRDCLDETLDAMLDGIASDRQLPKIIALDAIGVGEPTY